MLERVPAMQEQLLGRQSATISPVRNTIALPAAALILSTALLAVSCTTVVPPATSGTPTQAVPTAAASSAPDATPAAPGTPAGSSTALLPDAAASGERVYTLNDSVEVETDTYLEILEGWRDPPGADGQARYTFLARFTYQVPASPDPFGVNAGYYNAIGFSVRDDEGFEYAVVQGSSGSREPELLFGNLNEGQMVQGWVTFEAPGDTAHLDLVYTPISISPATFRVIVP